MREPETGVYVIAIKNVENAQIYNPQNVVDMCKEIIEKSSPNSNFELYVISSLEELDKLIIEAPENIIVVNGHGETLPIPVNQIGNRGAYMQRIKNNVSEKGWVLVSIAGVPFYRMASGPQGFEIGLEGANTFLEELGGGILGWISTYLSISRLGRKLSVIYEANDIPETIMCSRSFFFRDLIPGRSFYFSGNIHGVCSFPLRKGFLIISGLMPSGLGSIPSGREVTGGAPSNVYDRFMTKIPFIFALHIRKAFLQAIDLFERSKNDENRFREDIVIPMLRLKGFRHVEDLHRTGRNMEQGKDVICFARDNFGREIFYGFQIKAGDVGTRDVKDIVEQVFRGFTVPFPDTYFGQNISIHYMYVVTSGNYTGPAKDAIVNGVVKGPLGGQFKEYLRFLNGEDVLEEWQRIDF